MLSDRQPLRFGIFEINLDTGDLRRNGAKVRLQEQPFQVLAALLEKPGEIVTKEELQERIWKDDTFVDFDRSLATAINKVRQALGDSATRPRFIETVPKRGYRFVGLGAATTAPPAPDPVMARIPWKAVASGVVLVAGTVWWVAAREVAPAPTRWSEARRVTSDTGLTYQPTISRDGALIAYSSDRAAEGNLDIWVQHTTGGDPVRITSDPGDDSAPHFSPDGRSIVFRSEREGGGVYVVPSLGGFERFLAPRGRRPRFSPDGEYVAYFTSASGLAVGGEVYVVTSSGGVPSKFEIDALNASHPVWSSDGDALLVATQKGVFDNASYEWRVATLGGIDRGATGALPAIRVAGASRLLNLVPDYWDSEGFVWFSLEDADSADLWRIQVNPLTARVVGEPERILPGPGTYVNATVSGSGRILFASLTTNEDIWSLPIDANGGVALSEEPTRLTSAPGADRYPSISADGSTVTFQTDRTGSSEQWVLSTVDGQQRLVAAITGHSVVNAAGTQLAAGWVESLAVVGIDGIAIDQLPGPGGFPWHFSPDDTMILFNRPVGTQRGIFLWERSSGETTSLLTDQERSYFQGQFSPDGRWIAWMAFPGGVQVAPLRGAQPIPESDRIQISEEGWFADKPRWSPDGNLLYYTSDRDGFVCIYAQPLDPETKEPTGELLAIHHSHGTANSIQNVSYANLEISVATDRIVFNMSDLTGNIWMMEPIE